MTNPNPARITDELWRFRTACLALEPGTADQDGGIYADKPGYHNTRAANASDNYSVRDAPDKLGPSDKASAWDWTFITAQNGDLSRISIYGKRMRAAWTIRDPRCNVLREFLGQTDTDQSVVGEGLDFRYHTTRTPDSSHEWHDHFSFVRAYVAVPMALEGVLSVLKGESLTDYLARGGKLYKIDGTGEMGTDDMMSQEEHDWLLNLYKGMFFGGTSCGETVTLANGTSGNSMFLKLQYLSERIRAVEKAVGDLTAGGVPPAELAGITGDLDAIKASVDGLVAGTKAAAVAVS